MNKQEFQQTIKNMKPPKFFNAITIIEAYEAGFEEAKGNALCNSCFLDEPEKPLVPQFVADWYEENKDDFERNLYNFFLLFHEGRLQRDLDDWFTNNRNKPIVTLVKMKLLGYEVEKDKLYTVELPNPNAGGHVVLCKTSDGIVSIAFAGMAHWKGCKNYQLTESEIKKDFDWAWQFAKELEE
ncbi:MAG: DUF1642 domain-containing protein [Turicibacter sp.]|nr:DUF1642 domain-containing protein [Turicibacter sp.]